MGVLPDSTSDVDRAGVVAEAPQAAPEPERAGWRLRQYGVVGVVLLMGLVIRFTVPDFYHADNVFNLLRQASMLGIVAIGQTLVLLVAGIDLSVGAVIVAGRPLPPAARQGQPYSACNRNLQIQALVEARR